MYSFLRVSAAGPNVPEILMSTVRISSAKLQSISGKF